MWYINKITHKSYVIGLTGNISSGKTYGTYYFISDKFNNIYKHIHSPTFNIICCYKKYFLFYHIDCYKLNIVYSGIIFKIITLINNNSGIFFIEWFSKISGFINEIKKPVIYIDIYLINEKKYNLFINQRYIEISFLKNI